ncbi:MAG: aldo/keto reductase [Coriobacteriia bacterium]|nr:aldo/keto reductase [Coriobacteriia bacterium]
MQYIDLGATGLEVSRFGLGCMRFPQDEAEAIQMVRYAIDHGVTYIDTAYIYQNSEEILGKALKGGYREKIKLVTKAPLWNINTYADLETYLDIQLKRLGTDYLDVYLLHNLYQRHWEKVQDLEAFHFLEEMEDKGKIGAKGFSIHNTFDAFKEVVDYAAWDVGQIQLNILDVDNQAGLAGLMYGASHGLAMVIMEPLRGGNLVTSMPKAVASLIEDYPEKRSLVEWALRWLYDKPEVSVILSGTSTLEQLKDNLRIFEKASTGCLSEADQELIGRIRAAYEAQHTVGCSACRYCMPCAQGVDIPGVFKLYNSYKLLGCSFVDRLMYNSTFVERGKGADRCIACGLCQERCPQRLSIIESLETAHKELTSS